MDETQLQREVSDEIKLLTNNFMPSAEDSDPKDVQTENSEDLVRGNNRRKEILGEEKTQPIKDPE